MRSAKYLPHMNIALQFTRASVSRVAFHARPSRPSCIWYHNILYRKLRIYGVDTISIKWFMSYLFRRSQRCSLAGQLSNAAPVSCGIPQGSNLGPLLFLVYINDLPNCLRLTSPRMFADDTNITFAASTLTDLEKGLNSELRSLNI